ncbi:MAG: hypothetical protein NT133_04920 [Alphaproteobacteria bacterium]|nr:hypothetical protein [Alphaproteobacteria bacterium]
MSDTRKTVAIPCAAAKLQRLKSVAQSSPKHSGTFHKDSAIAAVIGLKPSRFSQLFGKTATADEGIFTATIERLIAALEAEDVIVTLDMLTVSMDVFDTHFPPPATAAAPSGKPAAEGEPIPPTTDFLPPEAAYFTGTDSEQPDPVAEVILHAPLADNFHGHGAYRLPLSLGFRTAERMPEGSNRAIRVGINAAELSVALTGYHFAPGTLLGGKGNAFVPPEGNTTQVTSIGLTGLSFKVDKGTPFLDGKLLDGQMLGVITPEEGEQDPAVRLTLSTTLRNFDFALLDADGDPLPSTPTKDALAALVYAKSRNAKTGRFILASATLRRKPAPRET